MSWAAWNQAIYWGVLLICLSYFGLQSNTQDTRRMSKSNKTFSQCTMAFKFIIFLKLIYSSLAISRFPIVAFWSIWTFIRFVLTIMIVITSFRTVNAVSRITLPFSVYVRLTDMIKPQSLFFGKIQLQQSDTIKINFLIWAELHETKQFIVFYLLVCLFELFWFTK